jgi:hypothetical protein
VAISLCTISKAAFTPQRVQASEQSHLGRPCKLQVTACISWSCSVYLIHAYPAFMLNVLVKAFCGASAHNPFYTYYPLDLDETA